MNALRALLFFLGVASVLGVLSSAVRTVIVPRAEQSHLNRALFGVTRWSVVRMGRHRSSWIDQDRMLARFAPFALMLLPVIWSAGVIAGFTLMFWSLDEQLAWVDALVLSGSSLTTLGFRFASTNVSMMLAVAEALIGLGIVALMISFLPAMYAAFSRRETSVYRMAIRTSGGAGVPSHAALFSRWWEVGAFGRFEELWDEWETWFIELEETHTSFPALNFFRSPKADRSWITAAGFALDIAALHMAVINVDRQPNAALMVRTGFLSLRSIADYFAIAYDPDPAPGDPISVSRDEFMDFCDEIAAAGVPVRPDRDQAWQEFAGWRVNYDQVLMGLCVLTMPPQAPWSSDRVSAVQSQPVFTPFRRRRR